MNENKIIYHFPKLNSKKVQSSGVIQYYMIGNENDPNISYKKRSSNVHYTSNKLYICAKNETSGQIIIENIPVTNTDKKLFLCIPLITKPEDVISGLFGKKIQSNNQFDDILQDNIKNIDNGIHLDNVLPENSECEISETPFVIIVNFKTPIYVHSYFTGLTYINQPDKSIYTFIPELTRENDINKSEKTMITSYKQRILNTNDHVNSSIETCKCKNNSLFSGIIPNVETFVEGMEDNPYTWMECDTAELDYSGEVPTFSTPIDANTENTTEKMFNTALIIIYIVISMIFMIFFVPLLYKITMINMVMNKFSYDDTFWPETYLIIILGIISIVLLIVGGSDLKTDRKKGTDELTAGGTIFGFTFISIIIMIYYKKYDINYLGADLTSTGFSVTNSVI